MNALTTYTPRFEADEIKSELEIAEEEYRAAEKAVAHYSKAAALIDEKVAYYANQLDAVSKAYRRADGIFKRSKHADTKERLRREMRRLFNDICRLRPAVKNLRELSQFVEMLNCKALSDHQIAQKNLLTARKNAGLIYTVTIDTTELTDARAIENHCETSTKTLAAAVSYIYQNSDNGFVHWAITKADAPLAEGDELDASIFAALIDKYDAKIIVVDAEFAEPNYATPAEEFDAIVIRAINYFALDKFLEPIAELRKFCRENPNHVAAQNELAEWLEIARANSVEVPSAWAIKFGSPLAKIARKFFRYWQGQGEYYGKGSGWLSKAPAILEEWRAALSNCKLAHNLITAFDNAVRKFNASDYAKDAGITVEFYSQPEPVEVAAEKIEGFDVSVVNSRPNKRGALICHCNGEKICGYNFGADTDSARRLINDTQMLISFVDSQREIIKFHEAAIKIWKKERADLSAGLISEKDLQFDDVPDFCNDATFNSDDFIKRDYDALGEYIAHLAQNVSKLKNYPASTEIAECIDAANLRFDFP